MLRNLFIMAAPTKDEVTEHELKLIGAMRHLKIKPEKVETTEELEKFMKDYEKDGTDRRQFPRLSIFYGEEGKGEVGYQTWKYEIECLQQEKKYPEDQILLTIRRSAKGEAANILRRLGVKATVHEVIQKFNSTFGDIDTPELIMKKFYAVEQKPTESLITYAARVEELFAQAVEVKALQKTQESILKSVFYQGIKQPLKQCGNLKYETIADYDRFKIEMRKIENDLQATSKKENESSTKCQAVNQKPSEMQEVKDLLKKMNEKINALEEQRDQQHYTPYRGGGSYRGPRHFRGAYNRGSYQRGRGQYRPTRPTGKDTFKPADSYSQQQNNFVCYNCGGANHIARNCPENK